MLNRIKLALEALNIIEKNNLAKVYQKKCLLRKRLTIILRKCYNAKVNCKYKFYERSKTMEANIITSKNFEKRGVIYTFEVRREKRNPYQVLAAKEIVFFFRGLGYITTITALNETEDRDDVKELSKDLVANLLSQSPDPGLVQELLEKIVDLKVEEGIRQDSVAKKNTADVIIELKSTNKEKGEVENKKIMIEVIKKMEYILGKETVQTITDIYEIWDKYHIFKWWYGFKYYGHQPYNEVFEDVYYSLEYYKRAIQEIQQLDTKTELGEIYKITSEINCRASLNHAYRYLGWILNDAKRKMIHNDLLANFVRKGYKSINFDDVLKFYDNNKELISIGGKDAKWKEQIERFIKNNKSKHLGLLVARGSLEISDDEYMLGYNRYFLEALKKYLELNISNIEFLYKTRLLKKIPRESATNRKNLIDWFNKVKGNTLDSLKIELTYMHILKCREETVRDKYMSFCELSRNIDFFDFKEAREWAQTFRKLWDVLEKCYEYEDKENSKKGYDGSYDRTRSKSSWLESYDRNLFKEMVKQLIRANFRIAEKYLFKEKSTIYGISRLEIFSIPNLYQIEAELWDDNIRDFRIYSGRASFYNKVINENQKLK